MPQTARGTTVDPEWSIIDPAAGAWFPGMALELVQNAAPALVPESHGGHACEANLR